MKVDSSSWLRQMTKNLPAVPGEKANLAAPADKFENLPHADFDRNLEKLRSKALRENGPSTPPPSYNEPMTDRDVDQSGFQSRLIETLGPQWSRMQYTQDCSQLQGLVPTEAQLRTEFAKLAADPEIPFEYIIDGCYARAHLMCDTMHKDNINASKIFCMVENPYGGGRLTAENKYMQAKWWYHVAPLVWAVDSQSKQVVPFVMDPSMDKGPMRAEEWIHKMWDEKTPIKVDVTRDPQYGPLESDGANATFEESLPSAHEVCAEYSKELEKIKEQYNHDHPDQPPADQRKAA